MHIVHRLHAHFYQSTISEVQVPKPIIVRSLRGLPIDDFLTGAEIQSVKPHGPFVTIVLNHDRLLVIHPMLAGRFSIDRSYRKALCFEVVTDRGILGYHDDKQMGKIYLADKDNLDQIPRFSTQGIDVLSSDFTKEVFLRAMGKTRRQVRVFLMDQESLSAIGNAYADEILYDAGIHPKTPCNKLAEPERERLYDSVVAVLRRGIDAVAGAGAPLHEKVRDHMLVRNRKGQPCPRCQTTIRRESVLGFDTFFCPNCQPRQGRGFIDWGKLPR